MAKTQAESDTTVPEEFMAWALAAGVPDPRPGAFPNQPCIPAMCFPAFSKMMWDFGFRHHPEEQTKWVGPSQGPSGNFEVRPVVDIEPDQVAQLTAQMAVEEFPKIVEEVAAVTPEQREIALKERAAKLLESLTKLQEATQNLNSAKEATEPVSFPADPDLGGDAV